MMGASKHSFLRGAALFTCLALIQKTIGFAVFPFLTHSLTPSEIGAYGYVNSYLSIAAQIVNLGLDTALITFLSESRSIEMTRKVASTVLLTRIALFGAFVGGTIFFTGAGDRVDAYSGSSSSLFLLGAVSCSLLMLTSHCGQVLQGQSKHAQRFRFDLISVILNAIAIFCGITVFGLRSSVVFVAIIAVSLALLPFYMISVRSYHRFIFDLRLLKRLVRFGAPLVPAGLGFLVISSAGSLTLGWQNKFFEIGQLTAAQSVAGIIILATNGFAQVWLPFVHSNYTSATAKAEFVSIHNWYSSALFFVASGVAIFSHEVMVLFTGEAFHSAFVAVPILILGQAFQEIGTMFSIGIGIARRNDVRAYISIVVAIVGGALMMIASQTYGLVGVCATFAAACAAISLASSVASYRLFPIPYLWSRHVLMWALGVLVVGAIYALSIGASTFMIKLTCLTGLATLPFIFRLLSIPDLNRFLNLLRRATSLTTGQS